MRVDATIFAIAITFRAGALRPDDSELEPLCNAE